MEDTQKHIHDFKSGDLESSILLEEESEEFLEVFAQKIVEIILVQLTKFSQDSYRLGELKVSGGDFAQSLHGLLSLNFGLQLRQQVSEDLGELFNTHGISKDGEERSNIDSNS